MSEKPVLPLTLIDDFFKHRGDCRAIDYKGSCNCYDRLEAENRQLRAALEEIAERPMKDDGIIEIQMARLAIRRHGGHVKVPASRRRLLSMLSEARLWIKDIPAAVNGGVLKRIDAHLADQAEVE